MLTSKACSGAIRHPSQPLLKALLAQLYFSSSTQILLAVTGGSALHTLQTVPTQSPECPHGRCQDSPGLYKALKKILVASCPAGSPPKSPQLGPHASGDKGGVCGAPLPTFSALRIYSAWCHENLNFKRGFLQLERAQAGNEKGEGERAGNFCAVQGRWDGFLPRTRRAGAPRGVCLQISWEFGRFSSPVQWLPQAGLSWWISNPRTGIHRIV